MEKNILSFLDRQRRKVQKKPHIIINYYIIIHSKFLVNEENATGLTGGYRERNCNMRQLAEKW